MSKDIGVDLLELCNKEFKKKLASDTQLKELLKRVNSENATYSDANAFSIRVGELLSNVFKENISKDVLPDGKMYYNIAKRVVDPLMKQDHACVSKACSIVQKTMNKNARNGLNALDPTVDQDRIDGIIDVVSGYGDYEDAKYMLDEPMVNFSQSVVDDAIKTNADFQFKSGMSPKIVRTSTGHCCDWCMNLVGVYNYEDVSNTGNDVFRRHKYCRCNVDYIPSEGKRQNVHSRQWYKLEKEQNGSSGIAQNTKSEKKVFKQIKSEQEAFGLLKNEEYNYWQNNLTDNEKNALTDYSGVSYKNINEYNRKTGAWAPGGKYASNLESGKKKLEEIGELPARTEKLEILYQQRIEKEYGITINEQRAVKIEKDVINYNKNIDRAISSAEIPDNCVVWRSVNEDALPQFEQLSDLVGKEYKEESFMSTTAIEQQGNSFTYKPYVFKIKVPSGHGNGAYMYDLSEYPDEHEVLLKRNSKFKITKVSEYNNNRKLIEMEMLE